MKRVYIAIAILFLCLGICILCSVSLHAKYEELGEMTASAKTFGEKEDFERMEKHAAQIKDTWNGCAPLFGIMLAHSHFDDLDEYINVLYEAAKEKNTELYIENCDLVNYEIKHLADSGKLSAENIL